MKKTNVYISGHNGMVGTAILKNLNRSKDFNLILASRSELDLSNQASVIDFFSSHKIDQVYMAAAKVGGIYANNFYPAEFIYDNLMVQANIINSAHKSGVQKILFLGSSCIYPRDVPQPMREDALITGPLEQTNEPYAIAKIAGIKLCESYNRQYGRDYRSVMPTNLYGPNDNYHPENSHVVPALIRRFHEAVERGDKQVIIWGSGKPMREFLHVDDMAAACIHVMNLEHDTYQAYTKPMLTHINVGSGEDCTIRTLAETVSKVTGFKGKLLFDTSKPDGTPRKLMDVSLINKLGWKANISLEDGLRDAYQWYLNNQSTCRK